MAVLVIAALFWGNCYSCPQMLLAQQKHGCCPHGKTTRTDCQAQSLQNFEKAEKASVAAPASAVLLPRPEAAVRLPESACSPDTSPDYTPPLHTSLRI